MNENAEPSLAKLYDALCKAQSEIESAKLDSENPYYHSRYASLSAIYAVIKKPFANHGLCVIQSPSLEDGRVVVETTIAHVSGQSVSSKISMKPDKDQPQAIGSVITYARRYGLAAMAGVCNDDDDGESAMNRNENQRSAKAQQKQNRPTNDDEQRSVAAHAQSARQKLAAVTYQKAREYFLSCRDAESLATGRTELKRKPELSGQQTSYLEALLLSMEAMLFCDPQQTTRDEVAQKIKPMSLSTEDEDAILAIWDKAAEDAAKLALT